MKSVSVERLVYEFNSFRYEFMKNHKTEPTDCVISYWILEEFKSISEQCIDLKENDDYYFKGIKLHPCTDKFSMHFYRRM